MGKKAKAHRAKVAKRNRAFDAHAESVLKEYLSDMLKIRNAVWEKVIENGFSTIDEAWEKAPEIFSDIFPSEEAEDIYNTLQLDWIRKWNF